MMLPKGGKYVCRGCGKEMEIGEAEVITTSAKGKETTVIKDKENDVTLPKTRVACPKCGHTEAYYTIQQTRSADEPPTTQYRCCKCSHSWREY